MIEYEQSVTALLTKQKHGYAGKKAHIPQNLVCLLTSRQKQKGLFPFSTIRHGYAGKKQRGY